MTKLPDDIMQVLLGHLRKVIEREARRNEVAPVALDALGEDHASLMFERAATRAKKWECEFVAKRRKQPTPLRVLARELVVLYADHTGAAPGRSERALAALAGKCF